MHSGMQLTQQYLVVGVIKTWSIGVGTRGAQGAAAPPKNLQPELFIN